ncbi:MAG: glycoside hydrolase family 2 [Bacteroidales bacterium]|nr:glycoside hydrolase family 2 [Bacteroidales bacterium]
MKSILTSAATVFALIFGIIPVHADNRPVADLSRTAPKERTYISTLSSPVEHNGTSEWRMQQIGKVQLPGEKVSSPECDTHDWIEATVPGTVLHSLVNAGVYPDPYHGDNNKITNNLIPDISDTGRDFWSYWYRTVLEFPSELHSGKRTWLQLEGVNYHSEVWLNGKLVTTYTGMFWEEKVDITGFILPDRENVLAIKVLPVDSPGVAKPKPWGAGDEWLNGGDGMIGRNVTMLMNIGWDFTFFDGIRDRNTGIWKNIRIYTTGDVELEYPFVKTQLSHPGYDRAAATVSVEARNTQHKALKIEVDGEIEGTDISFSKECWIERGEKKEVVFTHEEFPELNIDNPRLWWPVNKGEPNLYTMKLRVSCNGAVSDSLTTRFGIREIRADRNTPDKSKTFYVNGKQIFIVGSNWIPEAMCINSDERTYAELRYTARTGINLLRLWGGGITESEYFYSLCDELGILVWEEFWMTGDTQHPIDQGVYLKNAASAIKRTRSHPSLAFYVSSNESSFTQGTPELIQALDGTRPYQHQSECDGIHDGSPYVQVNPMTYYENTASERGSRIDGFNPEYGAPCLPTAECLREMMDEKDLWPVGNKVWHYLSGIDFYRMLSTYKEMIDCYGETASIDEYAEKAQFVGALNYKSIFEVWRYNKLHCGDRFTSGFLFWYHNSPQRQIEGRMWDWSLEPTAALYAAINATEPQHPQFDFLKNTVSVSNESFTDFKDCRLNVTLYDLSSKIIWSADKRFDLEADKTSCDLLTIPFPSGISSVHFIKLRLYDGNGKEIGSNFYWRSTDTYRGRNTLSGPCTGGFSEIDKLPVIKVDAKYKAGIDANNEHAITVSLCNRSKSVAFFTRLQWLGPDGKPVRPSFYSDNFFSMTPGEKKTVTINNLPETLGHGTYTLVVGGFHQKEQRFQITL